MDSQPTAQNKRARVHFAEYYSIELVNNVKNLIKVIYSNQCYFVSSGALCKQNCRIWKTERLQEIYQVPQVKGLVMVGRSISAYGTIGP